MAVQTRTFHIGLSTSERAQLAQDTYNRLISLTFEEYSASKTYDLGTFVVKDNILYKCETEITTAEAWNPAHWSQATFNDLLVDLNESINNKANVDGYYPTMRVGQTDSIATEREIEDGDAACPPITIGTAGGEAEIQTGYNTFEYLEGNSVGWNQILKGNSIPSWARESSYWGGISPTFTDDSFSINGTTTSGITNSGTGLSVQITGHKYLYRITLVSGSVDISGKTTSHTTYGYDINFRDSVSNAKMPLTAGESYTRIFTGDSTKSTYNTFDAGVIFTNAVFKWELFDLTLMFGSSNEPTTVDEFIKMFPKPYYEYTNGGIIYSAKSSSVEFIGQNEFTGNFEKFSTSQLIHSDEYIEVIGGETYALEDNGFTDYQFRHIIQFDADFNVIDNTNVANASYGVPAGQPWHVQLLPNTRYVKIQFAYWVSGHYADLDVSTVKPQFRLYWDTPNVPYKDHEKQVVELPNLELRGVGSARDIAYSSGGGKRRVDSVDLSTLSWSLYSTGVYAATLSGMKLVSGASIVGNILHNKYVRISIANLFSNDKVIACGNNESTIYIKDTSLTQTSDITGTLYYELAEETDISLEENPGWTSLVKVDNYGVIKFNSEQDVQVPQPYFIRYTISLTEFLDSTYVKAEGAAENIVVKEELEETLGGTLRNCLAVKESLDFNNTAWVDISTLSWTKQTGYTASATGLESLISKPSAYNVVMKALCSKYKVVAEGNIASSDKSFAVSTDGVLLIKDTSLDSLDATGVKEALTNVLLAYEKA